MPGRWSTGWPSATRRSAPPVICYDVDKLPAYDAVLYHLGNHAGMHGRIYRKAIETCQKSVSSRGSQ